MAQNIYMPHRPSMRSSAASLEIHRATPPMAIPASSESVVTCDDNSLLQEEDEDQDRDEGSYMDHYMRNRKPSISFDKEVRTDFGHRQPADEPLPKSKRDNRTGRSMLHELADERAKLRSHSESTRDHYDSMTGRHLAMYSSSPPRDEPHIGEARFPLLQKTVDEMARESRLNIPPQPFSPGSETMETPQDEEAQYPLSPLPISPQPRYISTSLEGSAPRPFRRTASQRWRDGEAAQDFFSRAGSLRKSTRDGSSYKSSSRRGTASSANTNSVASSFLRQFSMHSGDDESAGPSAVDAEGQTIGEDYVLGKQIGFGGFSIIKEVTQISADTGKQRKLAVKIVRRAIEGKTEAENDAAQAEFDHEVELWRFLNHPNILPLEAVYKLEEATFCFIPLNTGGTLFDLVRVNRQGLAVDMVRNYAYQIASALRYLHLDARVVHRDIKLENCLVDKTDGELGTIRLCDFGMADWIDSDHNVTSPGSTTSTSDRPPQKTIGPADTSSSAFAGGSLEYAPPEIVRIASTSSLPAQLANSESGASSPASIHRVAIAPAVDIWALGVCIYTMIVGKRPFSNNFQPRVVMAILAGDWDREILIEKAAGDDALLDLVEGCLSMNEKRRWNIRTVLECQWFEEERNRLDEEQDTRNGGWRL